MNKQIKTVVMFFAICSLTVACSKESDDIQVYNTQQYAVLYDVTYTIDGVTRRTCFYDDTSWEAFLGTLFALSRNGSVVSFYRNNVNTLSSATKDRVVFVTSNEEEAINWANSMTGNGYTVTISYDKSTGEYTCIAIK